MRHRPRTRNAWALQRAMLDFLESGWREPDEGIWEVRGPRRHFTHSKVMAWVAFDRAVKAVEQFGLDGPGRAVAGVLATRSTSEVCEQGFDAERNTFTQYYGSKNARREPLMIPLVGFLPADDPRVVGTVDAIAARADARRVRAALRRRRAGVDGLPPGEGVFLPCSFWLADKLALLGRDRRGAGAVRAAGRPRNDVGLLSEEYDPARAHARQLPPGVHPRVAGEHRRQPLQRHPARAAPFHRRGRSARQPVCRGMTPVRWAAATSRSSRRRATIHPRYTATCMTTSWSSS